MSYGLVKKQMPASSHVSFNARVHSSGTLASYTPAFFGEPPVLGIFESDGHVSRPARFDLGAFWQQSSASFVASVVYGLRILAVLFWYTLHTWGLRRSRRFDSLRARYHKLS